MPDADGDADAELDELLAAVFRDHGYDFRQYAPDGLRRRLLALARRLGLGSLSELQRVVLRDRDALRALIDAITIQVTQLFRDPELYAALRREVVPILRTYPTPKLWVAGCATGAEAHSLAIVLHEAALPSRWMIYATDVSATALDRGRSGIYPAADIKRDADSYRRAGGTRSLTSYFTIAHGHAALDPAVLRRIHFAEHNLVSDEVFGEMNVICCRNVLIYFKPELQRACVALFARSLVPGGFLCVGAHEQLASACAPGVFAELGGSKIFRKRREHPP